MTLEGTKWSMRTVSSETKKLNAIMRVHAGESKAYVARDIGVPVSTLRGWFKREEGIHKHALDQTTQPLNLSLRGSRGSYSPTVALDYTKKSDTIGQPYANRGNIETPKTTNGHMKKQSDRNRADLARLNVNFNLLTQRNTMMLQQRQSAMHQTEQMNGFSAPVDNSTGGMTSPMFPQPDLAQQMQTPNEKQYKHFARFHTAQLLAPQQKSRPRHNESILYQQLKKYMETNRVSPPLHTPPDQQNAENLSMRDTKKAEEIKMAGLVSSNNNIALNEESANSSRTEALEHGEIFLNWVLESCSTPSVSLSQIMEFKRLINKLKINGDQKKLEIHETMPES